MKGRVVMFDVPEFKPTVFNWLITGLMAVSFIIIMKYVTVKYDNPVTQVVRPVFAAV